MRSADVTASASPGCCLAEERKGAVVGEEGLRVSEGERASEGSDLGYMKKG